MYSFEKNLEKNLDQKVDKKVEVKIKELGETLNSKLDAVEKTMETLEVKIEKKLNNLEKMLRCAIFHLNPRPSIVYSLYIVYPPIHLQICTPSRRIFPLYVLPLFVFTFTDTIFYFPFTGRWCTIMQRRRAQRKQWECTNDLMYNNICTLLFNILYNLIML